MRTEKKEIAQKLIAEIWNAYVSRVAYAKNYAELLKKKGGQLVFDHLAFRTINAHTGEQPAGVLAVSHIFESLGYKKAAEYIFTKKKLNAIHLEHQTGSLPKIFISQLEVEQLPDWAQQILKPALKDTPYLISNRGIELLNVLKKDGDLTSESATFLVDELTGYFRRPWKIPAKTDVLKLNDISQYAAWTLLHGNSVNHFAAFVNKQGVQEWPDLETTCEGLRAAGIPMKDKIEGEKASKLQQSASLAVKEEVEVKTDEGVEKLPWTYAYLELTQRNLISENNSQELFQGFLGNQVRHLFDMTTTHEN